MLSLRRRTSMHVLPCMSCCPVPAPRLHSTPGEVLPVCCTTVMPSPSHSLLRSYAAACAQQQQQQQQQQQPGLALEPPLKCMSECGLPLGRSHRASRFQSRPGSVSSSWSQPIKTGDIGGLLAASIRQATRVGCLGLC